MSQTPFQRLVSVNEETWLQVGKVAEMMNDLDRAMAAYESALRQNPYSIPAMSQIAAILRAREQFPRAVEYFQSILNLDQNNGETWGSLGHCYLMMDDLQKAYSAYQQALYHLQNPKEPKLWYGIGILYDRYGSLEHAEEAFSQVMRMDPHFEKANEIYFRLGIIYKQQQKYRQSLECFQYIIANPPKPLTEVDIWFQIGHVYEQEKDYGKAKEAYERVLAENPDHAKVLQQLGWLYHQQSSSFANQDLAVQYLTKSLEADGSDAQSWYLLGRCYMAQQKYNKAYEAYQQAVYRDGRNPTFWCSIGVLYYQINQSRDALDAYSRAIRLNPYISEVWYDLGTLYESCDNQISDALDAYQRAAELDPTNPHIKARLEMLRSGQTPRNVPPPGPRDVKVRPENGQTAAPAGPPTQFYPPRSPEPRKGYPPQTYPPHSQGPPQGPTMQTAHHQNQAQNQKQNQTQNQSQHPHPHAYQQSQQQSLPLPASQQQTALSHSQAPQQPTQNLVPLAQNRGQSPQTDRRGPPLPSSLSDNHLKRGRREFDGPEHDDGSKKAKATYAESQPQERHQASRDRSHEYDARDERQHYPIGPRRDYNMSPSAGRIRSPDLGSRAPDPVPSHQASVSSPATEKPVAVKPDRSSAAASKNDPTSNGSTDRKLDVDEDYDKQ
ncbi:glucose repression mediator protein [Savitreella phatthalungensis]